MLDNLFHTGRVVASPLQVLVTHLHYLMTGTLKIPVCLGMLIFAIWNDIYKPRTPLRPIVSFINSPTSALLKYLVPFLSALVGKPPLHVRNSSKKACRTGCTPGDDYGILWCGFTFHQGDSWPGYQGGTSAPHSGSITATVPPWTYIYPWTRHLLSCGGHPIHLTPLKINLAYPLATGDLHLC